MADIIQFPKKESFIKNFGSETPKELLECITNEYDSVLKLYNQAPKLNIHYSDDVEKAKIQKFISDNKKFLLSILSELIIEKTDKCRYIHGF